MSALHCAAMQGRESVATALLEAKADMGARMGRDSAYHCALDAGHGELAERLAQAGCPTDRAPAPAPAAAADGGADWRLKLPASGGIKLQPFRTASKTPGGSANGSETAETAGGR